jgi:hypothetical protein
LLKLDRRCRQLGNVARKKFCKPVDRPVSQIVSRAAGSLFAPILLTSFPSSADCILSLAWLSRFRGEREKPPFPLSRFPRVRSQHESWKRREGSTSKEEEEEEEEEEERQIDPTPPPPAVAATAGLSLLASPFCLRGHARARLRRQRPRWPAQPASLSVGASLAVEAAAAAATRSVVGSPTSMLKKSKRWRNSIHDRESAGGINSKNRS